jgi:death-on-curing protein
MIASKTIRSFYPIRLRDGAAAYQKAAALCESLIRRPPFVGGNKGTGVTMGSYLLSTFGYEVESKQQELEDFGVDVARGTLDLEQIARWFEEHAEPV